MGKLWMRGGAVAAVAALALELTGPRVAGAADAADLAAADAAGATDGGTAAAGGNLGEVVVSSTRPSTQASAATKSDTPIAETAQSITVIDDTQIADLGLANLNQVLRYVAGVTPETRGSAAEVYDQFMLRGFAAPIYLDGLKLFASATGYAEPQVDISRLDRVEVLKGPASSLYGQSSPGGLVDESSKLPLDRPFYGAVSATYGSYDLYRTDVDLGGQAAPGVLWRVYGSVNGANQEQDYGKRERQTISGAVTVGQGTSTTLTLLGNYSHDPFNGDYGVWPTLGTLIANPAGKIRTDFYGGEPNDFFSRNQASGTYILKHEFGNGWAFRASGRYQNVTSALGIVYTSGSPEDATEAAPQLYSRSSYATQESLNDWTFDNQLTGHFDTGPLHHSLMFGFDDQQANSGELYAFGSATPINVFDPVYGTMPTPRSPYLVPGYVSGYSAPTDAHTTQKQKGAYAQDQVSWGGLRLTLSGRYDWASQEQATQTQRDEKSTWRASALYVTPIGVAPYASYSTSFEPQAAILESGAFASPSLGKQVEAGAKYPIPGTTVLLTGAWFRIEQTNVLVYNPVTYLATQAGQVRSQGEEFEASGSLPYGFKLSLAYSHQDVTDEKDVDPTAVGRGIVAVGRGGISANLEWAPTTGIARGLAIGGGVREVDRTYAGAYSTGVYYNTPSYTVFDALLRYDLGAFDPRLEGVTAAVNAANLFDKTYLTSCYAQYGWCFYGNRRTVQGTVSYHW